MCFHHVQSAPVSGLQQGLSEDSGGGTQRGRDYGYSKVDKYEKMREIVNANNGGATFRPQRKGKR